MATYYPTPQRLFDINNRIRQQFTRIDIPNAQVPTVISDFPVNGLYISMSEIYNMGIWPETKIIYQTPNGNRVFVYHGNRDQSGRMSYSVRFMLGNTEIMTYSMVDLTGTAGNMNVGIAFLPETNRAIIVAPFSENPSQYLGYIFSFSNYTTTTVAQYLTGAEVPNDPYVTAPDSDTDGGYGDFDYSGDSILPPDLPTISVADSGFVTLYAPTLGQLQSLAQYMWSGLFDISNFRKLFADPMDCIISLNILPVSLPSGSAQELKVGNIGTGQTINILGAQFIKIMFATKNIGVRTKSFMDFSPYVKAQLFLPFIGARSMSIDEIAGADITIEYHIDLFSGACAAYVTINKTNSDGSTIKSSLYQFNGNICANIPFTATNYGSFLGSLLQTGIAATTAIATQGSSSAVAGALSSGIDTATAIKPDVERSGNMSATNGFLGIQKPYLIITYPHVCKPACRDKTVGTPSFIGLSDSKHLSSFHGFTRLHKINVKGIPCTEQERQMIETLLTGEGVIMP